MSKPSEISTEYSDALMELRYEQASQFGKLSWHLEQPTPDMDAIKKAVDELNRLSIEMITPIVALGTKEIEANVWKPDMEVA